MVFLPRGPPPCPWLLCVSVRGDSRSLRPVSCCCACLSVSCVATATGATPTGREALQKLSLVAVNGFAVEQRQTLGRHANDSVAVPARGTWDVGRAVACPRWRVSVGVYVRRAECTATPRKERGWKRAACAVGPRRTYLRCRGAEPSWHSGLPLKSSDRKPPSVKTRGWTSSMLATRFFDKLAVSNRWR